MSRGPRIVRHDDAAAFLRRAEQWLLRAEAEHNLLLGLAQALSTGEVRFDPPIYLATIESDDGIAGCAFRTPPFKVGITRLPDYAAPALAADIATVYEAIPGVFGRDVDALAFGREWSALREVSAEPGMRQRIYQLERVAEDLPAVPGELRTATRADRDLVIAWFDAFQQEAGVQGGDFVARAEQRIASNDIHLWQVDWDVVSMAGIGCRSPNGARVGPVYTPPPLRGRGYATAAVADLSRRVLTGGRRFCFLYTDLANPTSNAIYERIGYRPVCDVMDVLFTPAPRSAPLSR